MKAVELPDDTVGVVDDEYMAGGGAFKQHRYVVRRQDGSEVDIAADRTITTTLEAVL